MGLTCSLLGHEYGEPETEREREERGDEVVEYVRTVEYCERCGRERVVSESTEVRSVRQAPPSVADDAGDAGSDGEGLAAAFERVENEGAANGEPARVSEPAEFVDAAANAVAGTSTADEDDRPADGDAAAAGEYGDAPADDDAELLTDDGDESPGSATPADATDESGDVAERATGADADDTSWSTADGADGRGDAADPSEGDGEPPTDDAVILTDDGTEQERERERGAWPSSDDTRETERTNADAAAAAEGETGDAERAARAGIASAGPIESTPDREGGGELVCPECGKRTGATGSSLRAGDICPDCHRGYLAESPESA